MRVLLLPLFLGLTGCIFGGGKADEEEDDGDDDGGAEDSGEPEVEPCGEVWIDYMGEDEPHVGDEWTIWLRCDDALLVGPTVIRFDPLDFASVNENVVTWTQAGEGLMRVQTGTEVAELSMNILE